MSVSEAARPPTGALWLTRAAIRKLFPHTSKSDGINHICQRALQQHGDGRAPGEGARDDSEGGSTLGA